MHTDPGIQPAQWIRAAIEAGVITGTPPVDFGQVQPNSLDLRVGSHAHRVQCSFLPSGDAIARKLGALTNYEFELRADGAVLEPNQVYLLPLAEQLALPPGVSARANPKSSSGRLDVFCRLVVDRSGSFDEIPAGYHGPLWLEVVPRSFPVRIRPGDRLAQIRFAAGAPALADADLARWLHDDPLVVDQEGHTLRSSDLRVQGGLYLSVRLAGRDGETIGYKARRHTRPVDLRAPGTLHIQDFWERLAYRKGVPVILEPDSFYIFCSRELIRIPPDLCAEMVPFDAGQGEVRTHYAGFFDSGFGWEEGVEPSSSASAVVLEVRNRDVPFLLEDGQPLFRVEYLRNAAAPDIVYGKRLGSNYQGQRLRLGKQFKAPQGTRSKDQAILPF